MSRCDCWDRPGSACPFCRPVSDLEPPVSDLEREVRAALAAAYMEWITTPPDDSAGDPLDHLVPVVVRLIEEQRAPLSAEIRNAHARRLVTEAVARAETAEAERDTEHEAWVGAERRWSEAISVARKAEAERDTALRERDEARAEALDAWKVAATRRNDAREFFLRAETAERQVAAVRALCGETHSTVDSCHIRAALDGTT